MVPEGRVRDSLDVNPGDGAGRDAFAALQRIIERAGPARGSGVKGALERIRQSCEHETP